MRASNSTSQRKTLCKVTFLDLPKPIRLFQPIQPQTKLHRPEPLVFNKEHCPRITPNVLQSNAGSILPNMAGSPKGIVNRGTRDVTWDRKLNTPRIESQARELININSFYLPHPTSLCSRGSIRSAENKMRPKSFKNFWSSYPESLEVQSLVFNTDLDALSIEIVRMYNEPMISLPRLDMGPAGV
jgi:hypothetical protein